MRILLICFHEGDTIEVIAGGQLPREAEQIVADHLEEICEAWDQVNQ